MTADNDIQKEYSAEEVTLPTYEDPIPNSSFYSSDHKKSTLISGIICLVRCT